MADTSTSRGKPHTRFVRYSRGSIASRLAAIRSHLHARLEESQWPPRFGFRELLYGPVEGERVNAEISLGASTSSDPLTALTFTVPLGSDEGALVFKSDPDALYAMKLQGWHERVQLPWFSTPAWSAPVETAPAIDFETIARFETLVDEWRKARDPFTSGIENFILPAYQQIIGLGPAALPLIFQKLQHGADEWFWALRSITGENPVKEQHVGNQEGMRKDWLEWASANNLV